MMLYTYEKPLLADLRDKVTTAQGIIQLSDPVKVLVSPKPVKK